MPRKSNILLFLVSSSLLAVTGLCGLCSISLILPAGRQQAVRRAVAAVRPVADDATQAARKNLIDGLVREGLVTAIDVNRFSPVVTVNRRLWDELEFHQKQVFADLWYAYCLQLPPGSRGEFSDELRIRDSKTHKELATFSAAGLEIH